MRTALLAMLALGASSGVAQGGPGERAFSEGMAFYADNRLDEAIPRFREAAAEADGTEGDGPRTYRAWLGEALRRQGQATGDVALVEEAVEVARGVLAEAPCHAHAHLVLADAANPQFFDWPGASADTAWAHLQRAVACDPDDGNAWLSLWTEALRRGEEAGVDRALRELARVAFWPPPAMAFARWVLGHAPPDAVLLTNGDADTVPMEILARVDGLRPDVAVVNVPLLDLPEAARRYASVAGLPLPDSVETFEPRYDARGSGDTPDGRVFTLRDHLVAFWLAEAGAGRLGRPVVGAPTLDPVMLGTKTEVVDRGAHLAPAPEPGFDAIAARVAVAGLDGAAFAGPLVSEGDRSPVRQAFAFDPGGLVLFQMLQTAVALAEAGDAEAAEAVYAEAVTFARDAGRADDPLVPVAREWIDAALAP